MTLPAVSPLQGRTILRFLGAMAAGNLLWEIAHVPLYTLWVDGTWGEIVYAVLHCTFRDVLIAGTCLLLSLAVVGRSACPLKRFSAVSLATVLLALSYTVFSEWLNTEVRESWTYNNERPNMGIGGVTPAMKLKLAA